MISSPCKIPDRHYPPDNLCMQNCEKLEAVERIERIEGIERSQPIDQIQQIQRIQKIQRNRHHISPAFNEMVKKKKGARKESKKWQKRNAVTGDS